VVVASTVDGAMGARDGGLSVGDIIFSVNRTAVRGLTELRTVLAELNAGDPIVIQLERGGVLMYLAFIAE